MVKLGRKDREVNEQQRVRLSQLLKVKVEDIEEILTLIRMVAIDVQPKKEGK